MIGLHRMTRTKADPDLDVDTLPRQPARRNDVFASPAHAVLASAAWTGVIGHVRGEPRSSSLRPARARPVAVLAAALLLAPGVVPGQAQPGPPDLLASPWLTDQGLPHNSVRALLQTRDGYLWIGTDHGLARFDGVRFTTYRAMETRGLNSSRIQCLHEDGRGALWIGTAEGGLARYQDGGFTAFTTREGLSSDTVLCLGSGEGDRLWVGTASGLNLWDQGRFTTFFRIDGLPDDRVEALGSRRGRGLLLATRHGVSLFRSGKFNPFPAGFDLPRKDVRRLLEDARGRLWIGAESGLWCAQGGRTLTVAWPGTTNPMPVPALVERAGGEVWCGTAGGILSLGTNATPAQPASWIWRARQPVTALCEDREGNVWVGTDGDGLFRLTRRLLRWIPLPEAMGPAEVSAVSEGPAGDLWIAAGAGGVLRWQNGQFTNFHHPHFPEGVVARCVCLADDGSVWIGTQGDGLYRWHADRLTRYGPRDGVSDSAIEALHADALGGVWIGTRNGGLNHWLQGRVRRFNTPWGYSGHFAHVLARDHEGALWIGTSGDGLFRLSQDRFDVFTETNGLPASSIHALEVDAEGVVWIGTSGGLGRFKDGRLTALTARHGLPEEAISQLQAGPEGYLWLGSNRGLFRVSRQQVHDCVEGKARFLEVVPYGKPDGLADLPCVPGAQVQAGPISAGRLWFPTARGLAWIETRDFVANPLPPPIVLERALVENETVPFAQGIRVAAGRENFQLHYTALSLTAPEKVRFRYQLEGFDREWNDVGSSRTARYTQVPPGHYRFRVRACNNDGLWNVAGASVAITVLPFWWQTAWFKWAVVVATTAGGAGLYQLRRARRREIERLRARIAGDLHDEVGSSLWSITLLSKILQEHGSMGDEERRDMAEIHRIAVQTSNSVRDIVWLINPAYDTVQDLVLRMKDFAGTAVRGVGCRIVSEKAELSRRLPLDFRQNVFLLYKEAVSNIARHAGATQIDIELEEQADEWRLRIRDNGAGFDPAIPTPGHGLRSLQARAARVGGHLEIQSQPNQGTIILFAAPMPGSRPKLIRRPHSTL